MTRRKIQYWVIPPEADAEFAAHMEEVLEPLAGGAAAFSSGQKRPHDGGSPCLACAAV